MADTLPPFGVTATGFNTKSFNSIKLSLQQKLYEAFGTIRIDEESIFGQLIGVFTEPTADEWLALEAVYNSLNPNTATDFSLDNIAAYIGVKRLEATATTVEALLNGVNQTIVPAGSEAIAFGVNTVFKLNEQIVLSNLDCVGAKLDFVFVEGDIYSVTINGHVYSHTAAPLEVKATIIDALVNSINTAEIGVTASNINDILVIVSNNSEAFAILHNENMGFLSIDNYGDFTAVDKGDIPIAAGALITIQTPVSGWISLYNYTPGLTGRNLEIDDELRARRARSLKLAGAGTVDAIRARILNIEGVTAATVSENSTNVTVGGLPPHSFESLVLGGTNQLIANTIWGAKPAGIATYGNVTNTVIDQAGKNHTVYFSRPVKLYIYANITLTKDVGLYPIDGDAVIKDAIVKQITNLEVGEDVVYQSLYQSIYSVPGITAAVIQIGGSLVETPPTLSSANVTVGASQIAVSDITKITVT
jgi:uncharacterized phage protein gp47/JayE